MLRSASALWIVVAHLVAAPCSVKVLDKMSSGLYWIVAYPNTDSNAATELPVLNAYVTPKYTQAACEAHWKGVITVKLIITESGEPSDISVINDPGFALGDAIKQTVRGWRFSPAIQDGHPIQSSSIAEFGFDSRQGHLAPATPVLRYDAALPPQRLSRTQQRQLVVRVTVDQQGLPRNVRVVRSIGAAWDEAGVAAVRNWRFSPGTLDGRPIVTETTVAVTF
jgi:TonB family protein